jgi:hypothetical protein
MFLANQRLKNYKYDNHILCPMNNYLLLSDFWAAQDSKIVGLAAGMSRIPSCHVGTHNAQAQSYSGQCHFKGLCA